MNPVQFNELISTLNTISQSLGLVGATMLALVIIAVVCAVVYGVNSL